MLSEKMVSLVRAIVILLMVFTTRFFYKISPTLSIYFDAALAVSLVFVLVSLFLSPQNVILSLIYHFIDILFVSVFIRYSGGCLSPFIVLFFPLIIFLTYKWGKEVGGVAFFLISIFSYVLTLPGEMVITYYIIIILLLAASYVSTWAVKTEIDAKNYIKEIQEVKDKLSSTQQTIQHLRHRISEEQVIDITTDLYNIKYFLMRLEEEIPKAKRHKFPFSLIIMGVDNFRAFNSKYGEKKGNEALRIIATLLKAYFRHSDLLSRQDGTDKFILFLPYAEGHQTRIPVERFREAVRKYRFDERDINVGLTISCGIASFPQDGDTERAILERAEASLRRAKLAGKDNVCFASEPKN